MSDSTMSHTRATPSPIRGDHREAEDSPRHHFVHVGLWLGFVGGILTFAAALFVFSVFRGGHPDVVGQGGRLLDTTWGAFGVLVLALGSGTMALALVCARARQVGALRLFLGLTLMCGTAFLVIKYIEGATMFTGTSIRRVAFDPASVAGTLMLGDPAKGSTLYLRSCMACHGPTGAGVPGLGKPLGSSALVAGLSDIDVVAFLKAGRDIDDPANTSGVIMPARGGNPTLTDQNLMDITAHLRVLQGMHSGGVGARSDSTNAGTSAPTTDPLRMAYTRPFCRLYLLLTGVHGFFIFASMGMIGWSLGGSLRRHFGVRLPAPVTFGGVYWHAATVISLFLYPLLYLIR